MKDKKRESERIRKGEQMYDFYFSKDFAYYICKVKGEEKTGDSLEHPWSDIR